MSCSTFKLFLVCLMLPTFFSVSAADDKKKKKDVDIPLYQGVQIGLDFISPARSLFSDSYGASVKADVNLRNAYFPTIEVGYAKLDKTSEGGIHFTSNGQYLKLGVNKSLSYNGAKAENMFFAGAHYGFTAFSYDLDNLTYTQNYWGNDLTSLHNQKANAGWIELIAGVRVQLLGPLSLGWTFQYKSTLHVSNGANSIPAYIPGYGENVKPNTGIAFHIYYKLPF